MDGASVSASPKLTANNIDANLIHEAAIGKIAGEQLMKLMTLGLTEKEAEEQAVEDTAYFQMRQRIMELMSVLDETDAKLISLRFGLEGGMPLSPEETGKRLNLTPDEVVAREANALGKLRSER